MVDDFYLVLDHIRSIAGTGAEKGRLFERFMEAHFEQDLLYRDRLAQVRLWPEWAATRLDFDGTGGGNQLGNSRMRGNYSSVDRLFAAAELRLGTRPQHVVRISRTDKPHGAPRCFPHGPVGGWAMTDSAAPTPQPVGSSKRSPGKLDLRVGPRRVVCFRRGLVVGVAVLGSGAIRGMAMRALQSPALRIQGLGRGALQHRAPAALVWPCCAARRFQPSQTGGTATRAVPARRPRPADLRTPPAVWDRAGRIGIVRRGAAPRPAGHPGEGDRRLLPVRAPAAAGPAGSDGLGPANGCSGNRFTRR